MESRTVTALGPNRVELVSSPLGALGPKMVRAKSVLSGVSHGTEMNLVTGQSPFKDMQFDLKRRIFVPFGEASATDGGTGTSEASGLYPCPLGYDNVARVIEVGPEVVGFAVGDRVWTRELHRDVYDFPCEGYPAYVLPDSVTDQEAIFFHLGQVALYACHDAEIKVGDNVAVFGLGAIGQLVVQMARLSGAAQVVAIDPIAARRDLAAKHGADLTLDPGNGRVSEGILDCVGGTGVDVAIETSASVPALHEAIRCATVCGLVVALGYYSGSADGLFLGREWHHNRVTMRSSMAVWGCPSRFAPAWNIERAKRYVLEMLDRKRIDVRDFPVDRVPFGEAARAYEIIRESSPLKVAFEYSQ